MRRAMVIDTTSRNGKVLESFVGYCITHPEERFWQTLLNWSGGGYIFASGLPLDQVTNRRDFVLASGTMKDTYLWEGRNV